MNAIQDWVIRYWAALALTAMLAPILVFAVLERLVPAERGQSVRSVWWNLKVGLVYKLISTAYAALTAYLIAVLLQPFPLGIIDLRFATHGNFLLDLLAALLWFFVFDFFYYWFHRAQHQWGWLWLEHRVHHATPSLNAAASLSHHWIEDLLRIPTLIVPFMVLFNLNPMAAGLVAVLANGWGYFIHANIPLSLGPLNPILCGPAVHRIHHSIEPRHQDRNFAAFFPVWDVLFGTYTGPERGHVPHTGVVDYPLPVRLRDILAGPLPDWWHGLTANWRLSRR